MNKKQLYVSLFFLLPLIYFLSLPITVGDLAVWVSHGKYFLETGHLLRHDIFSVLPTTDLIYPAGLSIIYAIFYSLGGLAAVSLFHKGLLLLLSYLWYRSSLADLDSWAPRTLLIVLLSWLGAATLFLDRPAFVAMVPFVLSYLILQKDDELSWKDLCKLVLINILWVNTHGSWLILSVLFLWREGARVAFQRQRISIKTLGGFLALMASSLFNPFGYRVFPYLLETMQISTERRIDEWGKTDLSVYTSQAITYYILCLVFLAGALSLIRFRRADLKKFLSSPFIPVILMGLQSIRNTLWPFFVLIPYARQLGWISEDPRPQETAGPGKKIANAFIVAVLLCLCVILLPPFKPFALFLPASKRKVFDSSAPYLAALFLNATPDKDPVFNDWEYGSFLTLEQKHPIFIDTRNIIYTREDYREYETVILAAPGWENILDKYRIRYLLLNKKLRADLIAVLSSDPLKNRWEKIFEDGDCILYRR